MGTFAASLVIPVLFGLAFAVLKATARRNRR